jgi:hypothetical protein
VSGGLTPEQAACVLANLANGTEAQQTLIFSHAPILPALHSCLTEANAEVRRPVISFILELARKNSKWRKDFVDAGIVATLKRICEWTGGTSSSPVARLGHRISAEDDKEIVDQARTALDWLEHGGTVEEGF